ncbi:serine protease [Longimycelium tulufanense]|uniref:Serine protease n=2 Tax=Longimycelium tulufanense TaxID=907463 RepID=A0A8J3C7T0_9PSEU|nr:S8 family peptidase [Longimycelium tulufanense]GGM51644.1 serine protease [Longimycelium tulufanense]
MATATAVALTVGASLPAGANDGTVRAADAPRAIKDSYIVVFKDRLSTQVLDSTVSALAGKHGGTVKHTYRNALSGFAAKMSEREARRLAADPRVAFVEQDQEVHTMDVQNNPPSWGLDRIDQRNLPLDSKYEYATKAGNVNTYVIDTGIRTTHSDFGGRARHGRDTVDNDNDATDCHGHGTHVAGTVGGAAHGVAKSVTLWAVRVLDCRGSGSYSGVIAGIDWVTANARKPAVANMSLGGPASSAVDNAVRRSVSSGITYAIAAGNGDQWGRPQDACTVSPARTKEAITVTATDRNDAKASWANYGTCVDIAAPGVGITSAWLDNDSATRTISGTSMATPHVAGAAALVLAGNPSYSPQQVADALVGAATPNVISNPGPGTPNLLLYTGSGGGDPGPGPGPGCKLKTNDTDVAIPDNGAAVSSSITFGECEGTASNAVKVEVHIKHTYRGDLVIDLVTPSGAVKNLKQNNAWDSADDVNETYTVDASGETKNGTWQLRVRDVYAQDTGHIDSWNLTP